MAPRILIFSIAMGADYLIYVKTIDTHARTFLTLNILAIGRVASLDLKLFYAAVKFFTKGEISSNIAPSQNVMNFTG